MLLALSTNIRLDGKGLQGTNTQAFSQIVSDTEYKLYNSDNFCQWNKPFFLITDNTAK